MIVRDKYCIEIKGDEKVVTAFGTGFVVRVDREMDAIQVQLDGGGVMWLDPSDVAVTT